jgi:hypothetical protein
MRTLSPFKAISHAFNSVYTYRAAAVRIGMFWIPLLFLIGFVELLAGPPDVQTPSLSFPLAVQIVGGVLGLIAFCSMAVNWHRFILRDEIGSPARLDGPVLRYSGISLLIAVLVAVPMLILLFIGQMVPGVSLLLLPAGLIAGTVVTRLSIMLPAVALGRRDFGFRDAWKASEGSFWPILGVLLLNAAVVFGILLVMILATGAIGAVSEPAGKVFLLVSNAVLKLFLTLFNASIFTSLYGYFVERREF